MNTSDFTICSTSHPIARLGVRQPSSSPREPADLPAQAQAACRIREAFDRPPSGGRQPRHDRQAVRADPYCTIPRREPGPHHAARMQHKRSASGSAGPCSSRTRRREAAERLPGWWNRDVMAHLAAQDTAAARTSWRRCSESSRSIGGISTNGRSPSTGSMSGRSNGGRGLPTRDVLVTWGQAADALLGYAGLLSEDEWDKGRFPWLAGEIAARYLIQSRVVEWWVHGEDMRATNGLGPEYQHCPITSRSTWGCHSLGTRRSGSGPHGVQRR